MTRNRVHRGHQRILRVSSCSNRISANDSTQMDSESAENEMHTQNGGANRQSGNELSHSDSDSAENGTYIQRGSEIRQSGSESSHSDSESAEDGTYIQSGGEMRQTGNELSHSGSESAEDSTNIQRHVSNRQPGNQLSHSESAEDGTHIQRQGNNMQSGNESLPEDVKAVIEVTDVAVKLLSQICKESPKYAKTLASLIWSYLSNGQSFEDNTPQIIKIIFPTANVTELENSRPLYEISDKCKAASFGGICEMLISRTRDVVNFAKEAVEDESFSVMHVKNVPEVTGGLYLLQSMVESAEPGKTEEALDTFVDKTDTYSNLRKKISGLIRVKQDNLLNQFQLCKKQPSLNSLTQKLDFTPPAQAQALNMVSEHLQFPAGDPTKFDFSEFLTIIHELMVCFLSTEKAKFFTPFAMICLNVVLAVSESHFGASLDCLKLYIKQLKSECAVDMKEVTDLPYSIILRKIVKLRQMDSIHKYTVDSRFRLARQFFCANVKTIPDLVADEDNGWCQNDQSCRLFCSYIPFLSDCLCSRDKSYRNDNLLSHAIRKANDTLTPEECEETGAAIFFLMLGENFKAIGLTRTAPRNKFASKIISAISIVGIAVVVAKCFLAAGAKEAVKRGSEDRLDYD